MRTVYAVFDDDDAIVEPVFDNEEDARKFVEETAKREFASMKANPERYDIDGEMVSKWHERERERIYEATDEGRVTIKGKWTGVLLEWFIKLLGFQEHRDDTERD